MSLQFQLAMIFLLKTEAFTAADTGEWPRQFIAAVHAAETASLSLSLSLSLSATMLHVPCNRRVPARNQVHLHSTPPTDSQDSTVPCQARFDDAHLYMTNNT